MNRVYTYGMRLTLIGSAGIIAAAIAWPQTTAQPQFEVASIRPSSVGGWQYTIKPSPAGFTATNIPLSYLITWAFKINDHQLVGAPTWASDRYNMAAKPGGATDSERRLMLQNLLEDRFKLKSHGEKREQTEYTLTIAKDGPKLKEPREASCPAEADPMARTPCGRLSWGGASLGGRRAPMQMLIVVLSQALGHTVVDETGLKGPFDMELRWTPDTALAHAPADAPPSLFTAMQEQMGLKLQARKGLAKKNRADEAYPPRRGALQPDGIGGRRERHCGEVADVHRGESQRERDEFCVPAGPPHEWQQQ